MASATPKGPYKLVTVNNVPERAKRLIGRVVAELADQITIVHAANCASKDEVKETVERIQPDILCCASMWTVEESTEMRELAKSLIPGIKTYAIPHGLQVQNGPDAIVEHLKEQFPKLLEGTKEE